MDLLPPRSPAQVNPVKLQNSLRHLMLPTGPSLAQLSALPPDIPLVSLWTYSASALLHGSLSDLVQTLVLKCYSYTTPKSLLPAQIPPHDSRPLLSNGQAPQTRYCSKLSSSSSSNPAPALCHCPILWHHYPPRWPSQDRINLDFSLLLPPPPYV